MFSTFDVGAVWITNRLDPADGEVVRQRHRIAAIASDLALQFQLRLRMGLDDEAADVARQALAKVENALGTGFGVAGGVNAMALDVVTHQFRNAPPVFYYEAGDAPALPAALRGVIDAEILGPCPKSLADDFGASDDKLAQSSRPPREAVRPAANDSIRSNVNGRQRRTTTGSVRFDHGPRRPTLEKALRNLQPDAEVAAAELIDSTLNNQSLVILFTCRNRKLLFVGDAQWGNWAYWLYGKTVRGKPPGISQRAREILASVDFYKVGHHGSTNATPIPVVGALPVNCAAMCSTETGYPRERRTYGNVLAKTEVPRTALMDALETRTRRKLVRSDWIAAGEAPASPEAKAELAQLPAHFSAGDNYIDYVFPD